MWRIWSGHWPAGIALLLAALFGVSGVAKVRALENLQLTLQRDLFLSGTQAAPIALALVAAEIGVTVLLILPSKRNLGLQGAMILSSTFMSFGFWRLWSGVTTPCSCFGLLLTMTPVQSIALSACILTGSIIGFRTLEAVSSGVV